MLIMALLVFGIDFLRNIMYMLIDVLNPFNEPYFFVSLRVIMGIFILSGCNGKSYINRAQWLKPQANLKWVVPSRAMKSSIVVLLHIRKVVIPHAWMFGDVHPQDMHNHHIDHLCLSIGLGMKGS